MAADRPLRILQINTADFGGGDCSVVWNLFQAYRARGHRSSLVVGYKKREDPEIFILPNERFLNPWARFCRTIGDAFSPFVGKVRGVSRLQQGSRFIGEPQRFIDLYLGREDFNFPGARKLLDWLPTRPDIIHCHNLHGGYFDLRALSRISQIPTVLTLHDAWLFSGHCAHSFDCDRWKTGCGECPDLTIYPAIRRDATAFNWQRKRKIFKKSRLYVAAPCRWLMQKVEQSMLAPAVVESRVIPNGVDLSIFRPTDRRTVRAKLGIPLEVKVILFVANWILQNPYKDYQTMRAAVARVSERLRGKQLLFLVLGEKASTEQWGRAAFQFIPYQKDPAVVARYYQAADIYLHAAHVETFPNVVIEALACGTPVVASAVGGIPEQIKTLKRGAGDATSKTYEVNEATGVLVPQRDVVAMADAVELLLKNETLGSQLGNNAAKDASARFDLNQQVNSYFEWYQEILKCQRRLK